MDPVSAGIKLMGASAKLSLDSRSALFLMAYRALPLLWSTWTFELSDDCNLESKMLQNLKHANISPQNYLKYCVKLPFRLVYEMYRKHKYILCLDLEAITKSQGICQPRFWSCGM